MPGIPGEPRGNTKPGIQGGGFLLIAREGSGGGKDERRRGGKEAREGKTGSAPGANSFPPNVFLLKRLGPAERKEKKRKGAHQVEMGTKPPSFSLPPWVHLLGPDEKQSPTPLPHSLINSVLPPFLAFTAHSTVHCAHAFVRVLRSPIQCWASHHHGSLPFLAPGSVLCVSPRSRWFLLVT